jgi:ParB-like chromosome segregation protein Spo0J
MFDDDRDFESKEQIEIDNIYPEELIPHPTNKEIYKEEDVDLELVESIKENGQLEPLVIIEDGKDKLIISGHRRWLALKYINEENSNSRFEQKHMWETVKFFNIS